MNHLTVLEVLTIMLAGGSYPNWSKTSKVCDRSGAVHATGEAALRCAAVPAVHHLCPQPGSVFRLPLRSEVTVVFTVNMFHEFTDCF